MVYFLGTDADGPCSPAWDEAHPAFYVSEPAPDELERVRSKFPHTHVRYLGSHEGCGCGFRSLCNGVFVEREGEEADAEHSDHLALVAYLKSLPTQEREHQIYGCWSGDESDEVLYHRDCTVDDLASSAFAFREKELITLKR